MYTKAFPKAPTVLRVLIGFFHYVFLFLFFNKYLASLQRSCGDNETISHTKVSVMSKFVHG